jgi:hypothetical protein
MERKAAAATEDAAEAAQAQVAQLQAAAAAATSTATQRAELVAVSDQLQAKLRQKDATIERLMGAW